MARSGRHQRGGRVTPKGTRPRGFSPRHDEHGPPAPELDLLRDVRRALAEPHPLGLLELASSVLAALDRRSADAFDDDDEADDPHRGPSRAELMQAFTGVDRIETSALLAAMSALSGDEVERRRVAHVVEGRGHRLPPWLATIGNARPRDPAVEMVHVLGDGDDVIIGVRFAPDDEITAVVYIDHNVGTLVKDAFVLPQPLDEVVALMRANIEDPETTFSDLPLADAKARIVDAIDIAARTLPPFESETWPMCRALVEWMVSLLPDGGRGYERQEWSAAQRSALAERFFASPLGAPLDDADHRALLDLLLSFGCSHGAGDPMRWSPVNVEILLVSWLPQTVVATPASLAPVPDLLRAFVWFCHAERGIPSYLTADTLASVDRWEPVFHSTTTALRPQGRATPLTEADALDGDGRWDLLDIGDDEPIDIQQLLRERLEQIVGGPAAVAELDDRPLPDEPFDWTGIPDDVHERVAEVLRLCDQCCDELLDVEVRTACRRLLARIAANGPQVFRRRGRESTAAAAICWVVCRINGVLSPNDDGLTVKALLAHFGLESGSVSQRARTLLAAGGFATHAGDVLLGSPDYLVARRRRELLTVRARLD